MIRRKLGIHSDQQLLSRISSMHIAILGAGSVGTTLGARWAALGHTIVFGSRDPASEKVLEALERTGPRCCAKSVNEAVEGAEVIILAQPWSAAEATLKALGDLKGRPLVDCVNPLKHDLSGLDLQGAESAAEQIAAWAPTAKVVKAFNTASVKVMNNPQFGEHKAAMFYCGDDAEAKATVGQLIGELGFDPVDAGPLSSARYLEPLAMLYIHLAFKQGWGSNCAFRIMKR
jgi:NADPH-dependent F420 reductase